MDLKTSNNRRPGNLNNKNTYHNAENEDFSNYKYSGSMNNNYNSYNEENNSNYTLSGNFQRDGYREGNSSFPNGNIPMNHLHSCQCLNYNCSEIQSSIANDLRLSNLERRLDSTEKMLKFYEEMLRLKEEEKKNEIRIDQNKISELIKKIAVLEENNKLLNKRFAERDEFVRDKIEAIEKKFSKVGEIKSSISDFYANKLADIEGIIKKNDILTESLVDDKISHFQLGIDSKLEEMLNLISDIGKSTEQNEFSITESKESIRMIQNDHLDFIKILSILKEKSDSLDYIMTQITDLKNRYSKLIQIYGEQSQEEDKFLQKILGGDKGDN